MTYQEFLKKLTKTRKVARWRLARLGTSTWRIRSGNRCPIERVAKTPHGSVWSAAVQITLPMGLTKRIIAAADGNHLRGTTLKTQRGIRRDLLKACGLKEKQTKAG